MTDRRGCSSSHDSAQPSLSICSGSRLARSLTHSLILVHTLTTPKQGASHPSSRKTLLISLRQRFFLPSNVQILVEFYLTCSAAGVELPSIIRPRQLASAHRSMEVYRSSKLPGAISLLPDMCSTGVGKRSFGLPGLQCDWMRRAHGIRTSLNRMQKNTLCSA
jgi:hypothetical protein